MELGKSEETKNEIKRGGYWKGGISLEKGYQAGKQKEYRDRKKKEMEPIIAEQSKLLSEKYSTPVNISLNGVCTLKFETAEKLLEFIDRLQNEKSKQ